MNRRGFFLGLSALGLGACSGAVTGASGTLGGLPADLRPVANAGYASWVAGFRSRAASQGISQDTLTRAFRGAGYLPGVVRRDRNQVEFRRTLEDYLSITVSDERVANGRAGLAQHRATLDDIEARYGVPPEVVTAIWGIESSYGTRRGQVPVISATSTLAYDGRRGAFFEQQLLAALRIVQNGDVTADKLTGSWAGAMGHTQFIPTSYQQYAVDFRGDGRRDIWSEDPTDALASTAAYLHRNGWTRGLRWGGEVGLAGTPPGRVIQPQPGGPRFAVSSNFNVFKRYNNSDSYAIAVGHLSDRIAGRPPLQQGFPPDRYGMTKEDRIALQEGLLRAGYDIGGADGVIGPKSREAIAAFQNSVGLAVTGDPSLNLVQRLR